MQQISNKRNSIHGCERRDTRAAFSSNNPNHCPFRRNLRVAEAQRIARIESVNLRSQRPHVTVVLPHLQVGHEVQRCCEQVADNKQIHQRVLQLPRVAVLHGVFLVIRAADTYTLIIETTR